MGMTREWAQQLIDLGYPMDLPLGYDRLTGTVDCRLGNLAQRDILGNPLAPCSGDPAAHETFHFVLNNTVVKDNRIPPYGMSYDLARVRNALPVPADQYGGAPGGTYDYFDDVPLNAPSGAQGAEIRLMYQPTSWEYIQFLHLANNGPDPAAGGNAFLGDEGTNLLDAWLNTGMAEPYAMSFATWGSVPGSCSADAPALLTASPADKAVTLTWEGVSGDPEILGYRLYFDQSGKAQLVTDLLCGGDTTACTSYTHTGLTNGQQYCYMVASYKAGCESGFSNILCAIPTQPGQAVSAGVVTPILTGAWITDGKGKNATTTFVLASDFTAGDDIVFRITVEDETGVPVPDATATLAISGPEGAGLTTTTSDAGGIAEATWRTQAPNKKGIGGTSTGLYTVTVTGLTVSGYVWNQVATNVTFTISP
jgi:hypothetical protein